MVSRQQSATRHKRCSSGGEGLPVGHQGARKIPENKSAQPETEPLNSKTLRLHPTTTRGAFTSVIPLRSQCLSVVLLPHLINVCAPPQAPLLLPHFFKTTAESQTARLSTDALYHCRLSGPPDWGCEGSHSHLIRLGDTEPAVMDQCPPELRKMAKKHPKVAQRSRETGAFLRERSVK